MKKTFSVVIVILGILSAQTFAQTSKKADSTPSVRIRKPVVLLIFRNSDTMFRILEGKWVFSNMTCDSPYTIETSSDKKTIKFSVARTEKEKKTDKTAEPRVFFYDVLKVTDRYIRTQIQGEKRKTKSGEPVKWDFKFASKNRFYWHRTDWRKGGLTSPVERCVENSDRIAEISSPKKLMTNANRALKRDR